MTPGDAPRIVAFDAQRALRNTTGLGNYARGVLHGLRARAPDLEIQLYSTRPPLPEFANELSSRPRAQRWGGTSISPSGLYRAPALRAFWRTFRMGRAAAANGATIFHGLSHEIPRDLPATGLKSVVTFLDLIYHLHPEFFPLFDRHSYAWRYRWSAEHADAIVAISEQTKRDLIASYGIEASRIVVIPPARDTRFAVPVPGAERLRVLLGYALPPDFLLMVATLEARKNQAAAIAALAHLDPARTPPLVLIGRDGGTRAALSEQARRLGVADRVVIRDHISSGDLPAIVQSAALFLYPSLIEGFGLPIVEALSAGVPVITSTGGCFPEAGGPESIYVDARDSTALASAIRRVLDDPPLAEQMRTAGRRHAASFDAPQLADRLLSVYDALSG